MLLSKIFYKRYFSYHIDVRFKKENNKRIKIQQNFILVWLFFAKHREPEYNIQCISPESSKVDITILCWMSSSIQCVCLQQHLHDSTRMHSSRMCTGQSLTIFQGLLFPGVGWGDAPARVGVYLPEGGVPGRGGCTWQGCTYQRGGVPAWRCTCQRGVYLAGGVYLAEGGVPAGGVPARGGVYLPRGCTCWVVYLPGGVPARGVPARGGCTCPGGVPAG